jgi:GAF domain-containing protein
MAYRYNRLGVEPASNSQLQPAPDQAGSNELQVPLMLRGELLGAIVLRRDPNQPAWTADELSLAKEAAGQVTAALENARLFEEVQARAAREQALSQLTAGFTRTASLETLLKRTAQELGRLPDVAEVSIQVGVNQNGG